MKKDIMKFFFILSIFFSHSAYSSMWDIECTQEAIQNEFGTSLKGKFTPLSSSHMEGDIELLFYAMKSGPDFLSRKTSEIAASENAQDGIGLVEVTCDGNKVVAYNIHFNHFIKDTEKTTLDMFNKKQLKKYKVINYDNKYELDIRENNDSYVIRIRQPIYDDSASFLYFNKKFFLTGMKTSAERRKKEDEKERKKDQHNAKKAGAVLP